MIEWIISSAVLILVVLLLRRVTAGRISSRLRYALWLLVLLHLLIPVSFGASSVSVENALPERMVSRVETAAEQPLGYVDYELPDLSVAEPEPSLSEAERKVQYEKNLADWHSQMEAAKAETGRAVTVKSVLMAIWIAGAAVVALCLIVSNLRFYARLRRSRVPLETEAALPVYISGAVETPCLFGLFRPAVYLTPEAAEGDALRHVLAHESTHARHGDHIWSALRGVTLALHWYDPLVWLAAALSRQDAELACDEGAILKLGEAERVGYGSTLIALATGHAGLLVTATTMSGGKRSLKERIALIAKKPKNVAAAIVAVLLIAAVAVVCTFTGGSNHNGWQNIDAETLDAGLAVNAMSGEVEWPETAYAYEVEFNHLANEQKIRELIGNNAGAYGDLYISDSSIRLSNRSANARRIGMAIPYVARPDATMEYQMLGLSKDDYGSADLGFMPLEKAAENAMADIEAFGVSGFELIEAYSIDKETLFRKIAAQLENERAVTGKSDEELKKVYPFLFETVTEVDECYFFVFRMVLDGVPVMTSPSSQVELDIFGVELYCLYNADGIIDLQSKRIPSAVQKASEAQPIISAEAAMEILSPYVVSRHPGLEVNELYFCYTYHDSKSTKLRPTWVLKTSGEFERMGLLASEVELVTIYSYYAIDAVTGEPLIREMKLMDIS